MLARDSQLLLNLGKIEVNDIELTIETGALNSIIRSDLVNNLEFVHGRSSGEKSNPVKCFIALTVSIHIFIVANIVEV